jgi:hypothetical protein
MKTEQEIRDHIILTVCGFVDAAAGEDHCEQELADLVLNNLRREVAELRAVPREAEQLASLIEGPAAALTDATGWPIVVGARVYVPPRQSPLAPRCWDPETRKGGLPGIRGVVSAVGDDDDVIDIIEFGSFNLRTVRARIAKVQRGETQESAEYQRILEALRRRK